jgi:hypothetical protein
MSRPKVSCISISDAGRDLVRTKTKHSAAIYMIPAIVEAMDLRTLPQSRLPTGLPGRKQFKLVSNGRSLHYFFSGPDDVLPQQ